MEEANQALNAKLGQKVMNDDKALWVKVVKAKYNIGVNQRNWKKKSKTLVVCKAIFGSKNIITKASKWVVGNGKSIDLFKDWWVGNEPINQTTHGDYPNTTVDSIMYSSGGGIGVGGPTVYPLTSKTRLVQSVSQLPRMSRIFCVRTSVEQGSSPLLVVTSLS